ncbi:hypothetical protein ASG51_10475 [Methylobacterium sp. Leaf465]|nr:hypothetical protein ASG51_10475 [Methylobacterium sp. Leaf465]
MSHVSAHRQRPDSAGVSEPGREGGRFLKPLRAARGLCRRPLATVVGAEYDTVLSQLETGRGRIPPNCYRAWAAVRDVPVKALVRDPMRVDGPLTHAILFADHDAVAASD